MGQHRVSFFKIRSKVKVLLLILLAISLALNVYLYYGVTMSLMEQVGDRENQAGWREEADGAMGWMDFSISKGFTPSPRTEFNVSALVRLWEPYVGSATYNFSFKIFERFEQSDSYPNTPVAEKLVIVNKDKNAMYIVVPSGNLTVTAPSVHGIYIYKLCLGTETEPERCIVEFPIVVTYTWYE